METIPYCGPPPRPEDLLGAWNTDPLAIALALLPLAFAARGRGAALAASGGLLVAFVSPLCALTVALFAARGAHHLVLVFAVAPALARLWPGRVPVAPGFLLTSGFLWLWHLPVVYALAWDNAAVYWAMQAGLILSATLFWRGASGASPGAVAALLGLAGQMGLIGAILTFAPRALYPEHLATAPAWGLDALSDQQLAGLVMWVPGMLPLAALAAAGLWRLWQRAAAA